jgi:hypothetical protein
VRGYYNNSNLELFRPIKELTKDGKECKTSQLISKKVQTRCTKNQSHSSDTKPKSRPGERKNKSKAGAPKGKTAVFRGAS